MLGLTPPPPKNDHQPLKVELNGTILHWVKVKGHSADTINDKADELATIGMHGKDQHGRTRQPRQLKYKQIVSHHYDKAEERRQTEMRATEQGQDQTDE